MQHFHLTCEETAIYKGHENIQIEARCLNFLSNALSVIHIDAS